MNANEAASSTYSHTLSTTSDETRAKGRPEPQMTKVAKMTAVLHNTGFTVGTNAPAKALEAALSELRYTITQRGGDANTLRFQRAISQHDLTGLYFTFEEETTES